MERHLGVGSLLYGGEEGGISVYPAVATRIAGNGNDHGLDDWM